MKSSKTHKHIKINGIMVAVSYTNGRWEADHSYAWGQNPRAAAREYCCANHINKKSEPRTVQELHNQEKEADEYGI